MPASAGAQGARDEPGSDQGRWKQLKGKLKEQWGRLTDDDLDVIAGRREQLLGRIQRQHGLAKDAAGRRDGDSGPRAPGDAR